MEDELSQSTHRQLEGHLGRDGRRERGRGRERERERERETERERERERERESSIKLRHCVYVFMKGIHCVNM